jgi:hypothetical protein
MDGHDKRPAPMLWMSKHAYNVPFDERITLCLPPPPLSLLSHPGAALQKVPAIPKEKHLTPAQLAVVLPYLEEQAARLGARVEQLNKAGGWDTEYGGITDGDGSPADASLDPTNAELNRLVTQLTCLEMVHAVSRSLARSHESHPLRKQHDSDLVCATKTHASLLPRITWIAHATSAALSRALMSLILSDNNTTVILFVPPKHTHRFCHASPGLHTSHPLS